MPPSAPQDAQDSAPWYKKSPQDLPRPPWTWISIQFWTISYEILKEFSLCFVFLCSLLLFCFALFCFVLLCFALLCFSSLSFVLPRQMGHVAPYLLCFASNIRVGCFSTWEVTLRCACDVGDRCAGGVGDRSGFDWKEGGKFRSVR